jgi:hypothetical protein
MRQVNCPVCGLSAVALPGGLYHCLTHGFDVFMYCADCGVVMEGECQPCLNFHTYRDPYAELGKRLLLQSQVSLYMKR